MEASQKKTNLTLQQKIEILIKIQEGNSKKDLLKEYNIGKSTFFNIIKNKAKLLSYLDNIESDKIIESQKRIRKSNYDKTSKLLYNWYMIKKNSGIHVKLSDLKLKALKINEKLHGPKEFQCSNGWIERFKEKYDIKITVKKEENHPAESKKTIQAQKPEENLISAYEVTSALQIVLKWDKLKDFANSSEVSMIQELRTRIKN